MFIETVERLGRVEWLVEVGGERPELIIGALRQMLPKEKNVSVSGPTLPEILAEANRLEAERGADASAD